MTFAQEVKSVRPIDADEVIRTFEEGSAGCDKKLIHISIETIIRVIKMMPTIKISEDTE